jgi:hypothetical protein
MSQPTLDDQAFEPENEGGGSGSWLSNILEQVLLQETNSAHQERFKMVAEAIEQEVEVKP